ncbi:hypothetical protein ACPEEZ_04515 [Frigoribacterium sp. 2-23]|uniref:hypothetical protein n=1 Tax=Frigoribacterium sp. 2-23 TaxID=3415006 RepID=UPI003C705500
MTTTTAYAIPFEIDRSRAPRLYRLVNTSDESVHALRVTLLGSGLLVPVATSRLAPGESVTVSIVGVELSRNGIAVVRWFRPSREEYLWRFSF